MSTEDDLSAGVSRVADPPRADEHASACWDIEDGSLDCICGLTDALQDEADAAVIAHEANSEHEGESK